jgi:hypothetical protein
MAEPMKTNCPNCQQSLQMPEEVVGRTVRCPFCKHQFTAAAAAPASAASAAAAAAGPDPFGVQAAPPQRPFSSGLPQVTPKMVADLASTRPWVLFLSILGFILCGLLVLGGIVLIGVGVAAPRSGPIAFFGFLGCIYILMALLYLFPSYFLLKYSGGIRAFLATRSAPQMEQALQSQKSFWKFVGILMIVVIGIYILIFVIAAVIGVGGSAMSRSMR